jgi:hypothetical protein
MNRESCNVPDRVRRMLRGRQRDRINAASAAALFPPGHEDRPGSWWRIDGAGRITALPPYLARAFKRAGRRVLRCMGAEAIRLSTLRGGPNGGTMSSGTKRPWADAMADAESLRALFPPHCYERWEFAGSLRRRCPDVSDVEHVVIPAFGEVAVTMPGSLFSTRQRANLLWHHLDALWQGGTVERHIYGQTGMRWGKLYRGIDYRGCMHEFFTTDPENWGWQLLIRTGPAAYSQRVVTMLLHGRQYRQQDGRLIRTYDGQPVSVPDEQTYLKFAGMAWVPPEARR